VADPVRVIPTRPGPAGGAQGAWQTERRWGRQKVGTGATISLPTGLVGGGGSS